MQKQICVISIVSPPSGTQGLSEEWNVTGDEELFELREPGSSDEFWRGQAELHECKLEALSTFDPGRNKIWF